MWEAAIGALGNIAGGVIGAQGAANNNSAMMNFNAQESQKNRDFQERMANTAYQRAMGDMRAAGLNPILAYSQGGAASPGGNAAHVSGLENGMEAMGRGVSSAAQLATRNAELSQITQNTRTGKSQEQLNEASAELHKANVAKANQETVTSAATAANTAASTAYTIEQMSNPAAARALMAAQSDAAHSAAGLSRAQTKDPLPISRTVKDAMGSVSDYFKIPSNPHSAKQQFDERKAAHDDRWKRIKSWFGGN